MTIVALTELVAKKHQLPKIKARAIIDLVFNEIRYEVAHDHELRLSGFGTFAVTKRAASIGRDPRTGEPIEIAARRKVKFRAGKAFNEALNPPAVPARRRA